MAKYRQKTVVKIYEENLEIIKLELDDGSKAYCFPKINGSVAVGDEVIVNITAVDLNLGTGGWHFVVWNLSRAEVETPRGGHIMKMRYSPLQLDVGVEEEKTSWDDKSNDLNGLPVICAPLHSQIAPIAAFLKNDNPDINIAVAVSDGASLPLALSDMIRNLKSRNLIDTTITFGHAFGGDFESINIYTALLAAKNVAHADVVIATMGPGIVGTNTSFGFTGIEVAQHLDAGKTLGARTFGVIRASSADPRERHRGISHHAITTFSRATNAKHNLGVISDHQMSESMISKLHEANIYELHDVTELKSVGIVDLMESLDLEVRSMGRSAREDELFNEMSAAPAQLVVQGL